jgi:hypothetical protein
VVSGNESSSLAEGPSAGELLLCSYMNIWRKEGKQWRLVARHLGLISRASAEQAHTS